VSPVATRPRSGAVLAVSFLTVVPVPARPATADISAAAPFFPVVGGLVGAAAGGVRVLADGPVGATTAAVLAVLALVALTGALHQDGLADCADGLGVRGDRERRLAVLRDPALGVYGVLALVLWALLMVSALSAFGDDDALPALVLAGALGRWAALVHATAVPPARPDGLGAGFRVSPLSLAAATVVGAAAAVALAGPAEGAAAAAAAGALALLTARWARSALGGRTGDTLGACAVLAEAAVVVVLLGLR
jgi:adenosylcobinamide-GDP ribazoletransferase